MKILLSASLYLLFFSCNVERKIYTSAKVNDPALKEKGDYEVSNSFSLPVGADINGGFAISNHFAVIAGANIYKNKDNEKNAGIFSSYDNYTTILRYQHIAAHIGAGIYYPVGKRAIKNTISFFGGYMKGDFKMKEINSANYKNFYFSDLNRWFSQASFHINTRRLTSSFILRYTYAGYLNVATDYTPDQQRINRFPPNAFPAWSSFLDANYNLKIFLKNPNWLAFEYFMSTTADLRKHNFQYYPFRTGVGVFIHKRPAD